ncbi:MAG: ABC transporter substrate-binding protein [Candidatus Tectomicrobia bacterium]|nr:ABC transporter substrate-binding protein [Candidatus Tectomicrobia bacterium]
MHRMKLGALVLSAVMLIGLWAAPSVVLAEEPQRGGVLRVAIAGDPPSLDMHQEQTFKVLIPMSTCYNTLLRFDPHGFPKIIGDLAESWEASEDGLTYTFKLHEGVKFHSGDELTGADVAATWNKIVFPPSGISSPRKSFFQMVESVEAPEKYTVAFKLKYPSASFLSFAAHPANLIYSKKYIDKEPHWYKHNVNGTGPFTFKKWVRGSTLEVERNPDYFREGLPYMDGAKYFMIKDLSARAKSVRSGRTDVEFRGFPPSEVEAMKKQLGDQITVRYPKAMIQWGVAFNVTQKPFDDERVRKALSLAIDRYDMAKTLAPLSGLETVGGLIHPDAPWALTPEELQELPGLGKDHEANLAEAKRLLKEAGYEKGLRFDLVNRSVKLPYIDLGVYIVSAWKKIGVEAEHKLEESATWSKTRKTGNFAAMIDPYGSSAAGDPDEVLVKFQGGASANWGKFSDPKVDELFEMQKVERDEQKRIEQVKELQKQVINNAYWIPGLWWTRIEVRSSKINNYEPHHSHWMNRRLEDVWLAQN